MTVSSTPNLAARILAKIDEVERGENGRFQLGEPRLTPCPQCGATLGSWSRYGDPAPWEWTTFRFDGEAAYEMKPCRCRLTLEQFKTVVGATSCPDQAVLRRCAADRRILARHRPEAHSDGRLPGFCKHCGWRWPCPDLRDLADAHGLSEGDNQ